MDIVAPAPAELLVRRASAAPNAGGAFLRRVAGGFEDVVLLILVVYLFPFAILAIGMPIALLARLVLEVGSRWQR